MLGCFDFETHPRMLSSYRVELAELLENAIGRPGVAVTLDSEQQRGCYHHN